jgi:hypothetical protein
MSIEVKHYTKEEIEAIKHEITPIHRVHNHSFKTTFLDAEPSNSKMSHKRRGENVNKERG